MSQEVRINHLADGGIEEPTYGNRSIILYADTTSSASVSIPFTNNNGNRLTVYFNISTLPGSGSTTLALKIRSVNPVTGGFFTLLSGAARSASGTTVMMVGPGISASALGVAANVPRALSFLVSQSSGATSKDVTFSIGLDINI